ncbi:DUF262 domain-containing protein [Aliarcobacter butzleri]|uniref:GmrSD restriction endonucleases N-terminal domain-containing protein n=1 Tax=Aliarcobacter butzleri L351 TaxID=1447259 RepID=A0A837J6M5_9BACT|nr:DUF262 domain-containing protein [Aliarcobacter butzleri]KLE02189.1 hypothetical protein AF76_02815 [Aliarcobacter butzleri L351]KLE13420.1 hypothetical protein AF75_03605 [Aliarcobacter butzleri L350]
MSLQLRAEQKKITDIFNNEVEYIIPNFQRPYSWGYSQCYQLYSDIFDSFERNEEFFLGNIVTANSQENNDFFQLIDGQQRITTLLLWIKALFLLYEEKFGSEHGGLKKALYKEDWESGKLRRRLISNILETKDDDLIEIILSENFSQEQLIELFNKNKNRLENKIEDKVEIKNKFEMNFIYLYYWSKNDYENNLKEFIIYLLKKVMLLPMQLNADNTDEAINKALKIFETINNRGMDLADSDILKAKIYALAIKDNNGPLFIKKWIELRENLEIMNVKIDDIFRFYLHIIRGHEKLTTSEIGLRDFFTLEPYSPLKTKDYNEILDDLYNIVFVYEYIDEKIKEKSKLSKWLQVIENYTNQYPKIALVVFLFYTYKKTGSLSNENIIIDFCKNIIRYVYYKGATSTIKNEIYLIIKNIAWDIELKKYEYNLSTNFFDSMGRLKKGFALLSYYLNNDDDISNLSFNRLITYSDKDFNNDNIDDIYDCLGNFVFLDLNKRNISFESRIKFFDNSNIFKKQINPHLIMQDPLSFIKERDEKLKNKLIEFMKGLI